MLFRLLAIIGLLWTGKQALKQVTSVLRPRAHDHDGSASSKEDDEIVKDPVCLTYIPKSLAVQKTFNEKTWYFCSEECADKFQEQLAE
ncbi:MAG: YHS domain-containing protein [Candidatus Vecturithrix sp.]|nr:YHS domain-containing protein [Candidatus Vecturithrix sp.]